MPSPQELLDVEDRALRRERAGRPATEVVFEAVREVGVEPTDRVPLAERIDGDALDELVPPGHGEGPVVVFEVWGHRVAVTPATVVVFGSETEAAGSSFASGPETVDDDVP